MEGSGAADLWRESGKTTDDLVPRAGRKASEFCEEDGGARARIIKFKPNEGDGDTIGRAAADKYGPDFTVTGSSTAAERGSVALGAHGIGEDGSAKQGKGLGMSPAGRGWCSRPVFSGQDWRVLEPGLMVFCHKVSGARRV